MEKKIKFSMRGTRADIGTIAIQRMLPNKFVKAVGPFVFLDQMGPINHEPNEPIQTDGIGAHPHRGIATLTYLLNGEEEHFDSRGNYGKIRSGGVQWMKAGNGVIHDGNINVDSQSGDLLTHGFQFWVNLPARNKIEQPEYLAIQAEDVPKLRLKESKSWLKVIVGQYENLASQIPTYSDQFIYHLHLKGGDQFSLPTENAFEYAAFLPLDKAMINGSEHRKGELIVFDRSSEGAIEIRNISTHAIEVILFGGAKYTEPIVFGGPFVMNSESEITEAYKDFYAGKYGTVELKLAEA